MIRCEHCHREMTTIEAANCDQTVCPVRGAARFGARPSPGAPYDPRITRPEKPAENMTIREALARDFMVARLSEHFFAGWGGNAKLAANDAVAYADALIDRLNGKNVIDHTTAPPDKGVRN